VLKEHRPINERLECLKSRLASSVMQVLHDDATTTLFDASDGGFQTSIAQRHGSSTSTELLAWNINGNTRAIASSSRSSGVGIIGITTTIIIGRSQRWN
jgi:hypothetical protein